jgi:hypothetical protein
MQPVENVPRRAKRSNERSEITPKGLNMKRSNERSEIIALVQPVENVPRRAKRSNERSEITPKGLNVIILKKETNWTF